MGAGNYYRLEDNRDVPMYWVDIECLNEECNEDNYCYCQEYIEEDIHNVLSELPKVWKGDKDLHYGAYYDIEIKSNYYGDGLLIDFRISPMYDDTHLAHLNLETCYNKIIRHLNKSFEIYQGHGYTSSKYGIGEFK